VPNMTMRLSVSRSDFRRPEPNEVALKMRLDGPDRSYSQQQAAVPSVQSSDERALFHEVFLPHMAEAHRLAHWLTSNSYDTEDVVQAGALRGIKGFGAVNARAWSLTIVRNTAYSWLMKYRPKAIVFQRRSRYRGTTKT
jgi:RNA polymerase sigma-70 factor, ECF subfamily